MARARKTQELETVEAAADVVVTPQGTVVRLDHPDEVAQALADVRTLETQLRTLKSALTQALVDEAQRQGSKTLRFGDLKVEVTSPVTVTWDLEELAKLLDAGLPQDRYDALVKTEVTYKVDAREAKRIAGSDRYRAIIERARVEGETAPRASVTR